MILLSWLARFAGMVLIGCIVLAGLSAIGLYQAADLVQRVKDLLAIDVLNFVYWPFGLIEFAWFEITLRERAFVAFVWAMTIVPALRGVAAGSSPELVYAAVHGHTFYSLINFPASLFGSVIFALIFGIVCYVLPDGLSVVALSLWMGFIHYSLLLGSVGFIFSERPNLEDEPEADAIAYQYMTDRYRVILAAKTYGEMAVGTMVVYWFETLALASGGMWPWI